MAQEGFGGFPLTLASTHIVNPQNTVHTYVGSGMVPLVLASTQIVNPQNTVYTYVGSNIPAGGGQNAGSNVPAGSGPPAGFNVPAGGGQTGVNEFYDFRHVVPSPGNVNLSDTPKGRAMQVAAEAGWTEGAPENMLGFLETDSAGGSVPQLATPMNRVFGRAGGAGTSQPVASGNSGVQRGKRATKRSKKAAVTQQAPVSKVVVQQTATVQQSVAPQKALKRPRSEKTVDDGGVGDQ